MVRGLIPALDELAEAAGDDRLDSAAALPFLTIARGLAAQVERSELALIDAARDSGATWAQIAAAMGARNRQTAQKRHADLSLRHQRPPSVDARPEGQTAAPRSPGSSPTSLPSWPSARYR